APWQSSIAPACSSSFLSVPPLVFAPGCLVARSTGRVESAARFPEGGDPSSTSWMSPSVPAFLLSRSWRDRRNALLTGSTLAAAPPRAVHRHAYLARRTLISHHTRCSG